VGQDSNPAREAKAGSESCPTHLLTQAREILAQLERWAESCPANFRHKALLIRAELAGIQCLGSKTRKSPEQIVPELACYDEAAAFARAAGYLHHAALALELAGEHSLRNHNPGPARRYLTAACRTYEDWGALAKAEDIKQRLTNSQQPAAQARESSTHA
jgi:hypothetical protein